MLETTECIIVNNKGRKYTDCMEFSLLRFLHLLFFDEKEIQTNNFSKWNYDKNFVHNDLQKFINKYPFIYRRGKYYEEILKGKNEREKWSILVSDRNFFEYYRNDSSELFTNINNILLMFKHFFCLKLKITESEYNNDLNLIAKTFSTESKNIKFGIKSRNFNITNTTMQIINQYLSRIDEQYISKINNNKIYKMIIKKTILDISINDDKYEWHLTEYLLDQYHKEIDNKFITGHSVIYKITK